jgi:NAD(P)-dependent dehydrogenase (short-subunit alcohol dehydrogenase family)
VSGSCNATSLEARFDRRTSSAQCAAIVQDVVSHWGQLDSLDNNVGIGSKGTVVGETDENWAHVMNVNVDSMFRVCKHAIPAMIRTAGGGAIVNVSSISALRRRGITAYTVSKGTVIGSCPMVWCRSGG